MCMCHMPTTAAFQGTHRVRVYDIEDWSMVKDIHARGLRWTVTDTALSPDGRFLLYATIDDIVRMVRWDGLPIWCQQKTSCCRSIWAAPTAYSVQPMSLTFMTTSTLRPCQRMTLRPVKQRCISEGLAFGAFSGALMGKRSLLEPTAASRQSVSMTWSGHRWVYTTLRACRLRHTTTNQTVVRAKGHQDDVNAVAFAERDNSNIFFSGSDDLLCKVWTTFRQDDLRGFSPCTRRCGTGGSSQVDERCLLAFLWDTPREWRTSTARCGLVAIA